MYSNAQCYADMKQKEVTTKTRMKETSTEKLRQHGVTFNSYNRGVHLVLDVNGLQIDFFPTSGHWMYRVDGKRGYCKSRGVDKLLSFVKKIKTGAPGLFDSPSTAAPVVTSLPPVAEKLSKDHNYARTMRRKKSKDWMIGEIQKRGLPFVSMMNSSLLRIKSTRSSEEVIVYPATQRWRIAGNPRRFNVGVQSLLEYLDKHKAPSTQHYATPKLTATPPVTVPAPERSESAIERIIQARKKNRIFLSGPAAGTMYDYDKQFEEAANIYKSKGWVITNAGKHDETPEATWTDYTRDSVRRISTSKAILMLPGWEQSEDARMELKIAKSFGMYIIYHKVAK